MKAMFDKLTIGIPKETYQILKRESAKLGVPMAEVVRRWLEKYPIETHTNSRLGDQVKSTECKIQEEFKSLHPLIQENNLLLRKIARYTNSQIVIETDEQLKHLRKKAGT
jgi:predicted DNA-binding protein